jgi:hypothetical protein
MAKNDPVPRASRLKPQADIVFCIDVTGSMGGCIEAVKDHLNVFVSSLANEQPVDFRLRLIAYRDLHDPAEKGPPWTVTEFSKSVDDFKNALAEQEAAGGGPRQDGESTLDALYLAIHSDWRPRQCHKTIILFTDEPPHPRLHRSTYSKPDNTEMRVLQDFQKLRHTMLYMVAPKHHVYETIVEGMRYAAGEKDVFFLETAHGEGMEDVEWEGILAALGNRVSESSSAAAEQGA